MGYDMYLYLEGLPGEKRPIVICILAWSHGFSSAVDSPVPTIKPVDFVHPDTWDVKGVSEWLRKNNLENFVKHFEENEISGKELLSVALDDLKDMVPSHKIGHRLRFFNAQQELQAAKEKAKQAEEDSKVRVQDISMTAYLDDRCTKAYSYLFSGTVIPEARLVCYKGTSRYGRNQPPDAELAALEGPQTGDILMSVLAKNCIISSFSTGGSGGEDRFTVNLTLMSNQFNFMHQEYPATEAINYREFFERPHGIFVSHEKVNDKTKTVLKEWGKQLEWTRETHFSFPQEFKAAVKTTLLAHNSKQNGAFSKVPADILKRVFYHLSQFYIPTNPMEGYPYPGRINATDDDN